MQKIINLLLVTCFVLLVLIISFSMPSQAQDLRARDALRKTALMVNGVSCSGSGSVVSGRSGHLFVLTNNHVCNCAAEKGYFFSTTDEGEVISARIVKRSWAYDLCAGAIEGERESLKISTGLMPLTEVNSRGYPGRRMVETHGTVGGNQNWTYDIPIEEIGSCPSNAVTYRGLNDVTVACGLSFTSTMTNLYGRPGSSGSPVVNDAGQLVGVVSSWMPGREYSAGMVPFNQVENFLSTL